MVAGRGDQLCGAGEVGAGSLAIALRKLEPGVVPDARRTRGAACRSGWRCASPRRDRAGRGRIARRSGNTPPAPAARGESRSAHQTCADRRPLGSGAFSLGEIAAPVGLVGQKLGPAEREVVEGDVEQNRSDCVEPTPASASPGRGPRRGRRGRAADRSIDSPGANRAAGIRAGAPPAAAPPPETALPPARARPPDAAHRPGSCAWPTR